MGRPVKKGSTDKSTTIRIIDSTTGAPETAVEHDTAGIDLWYRREGATKTSITEAALAALDSAHSDGGIEHIGDGYYRLDLPDAAWATGASYVTIGGTVTGMIVIGNEHALVNYDPEDAVRLGLTALPNAAADAAGGLPISDAGGLDLDAKLANTNEVTAARMGALTDWINGGRLDLLLDAILEDTATTLPATLATIAGYIDTEIGTIITNIAALPTTASIKTALEAAGSHLALIKAVTDAIPDAGALTTLSALVDDLETRLTAARAGYLDELGAANLPADIDTLKTYCDILDNATNGLANIKTLIDTIDTVVDAIKAKTDNLPTDPADESSIQAAITALNDITVADIIAGVADGSYDLQEMLRVIFAACSGKSTGGGTSTIAFRDPADVKNRISATVDTNGNRTAVTLDVT
jgi:hypothetical protein